VVTGRNTENLQKVVEECAAQPGATRPVSVVGDMIDEAHVKNLVEATVKSFGKLDILVNSAGCIEFGSIETTSLAQFDHSINLNVRSVYHVTMLAVPYLIKTKGSIVNVSSVTGTRSFPNVLTYCMSKSAIDQFTSCVALELAPKGVRVNSVNPGVIVTSLHKAGGLTDEAYDKFLAHSRETHPLGRTGTVEEVARAIAFLASDAASFTTGDHLHVDGGRHAACPR